MSLWNTRITVRHPDWILDAISSLSKTAALYATRQIPGCIEAPMIVIPVKRVLRGVYGSDLRAALALLGMALADLPDKGWRVLWCWWMFTVRRVDREAYFDERMAEMEAAAREDSDEE